MLTGYEQLTASIFDEAGIRSFWWAIALEIIFLVKRTPSLSPLKRYVDAYSRGRARFAAGFGCRRSAFLALTNLLQNKRWQLLLSIL
jgi:hypothetical protein